ncbi:uncharacterized protein LOC113343723 [Papaver somniferum]|uniref:uncharacterized protein LOC113343723 n=1 Tax=Papaver somniferum TaxID=3469 RepID=UPI000E704234|nr:uncharacterized protein LOC113343723 [Papaver somniferum]
MFLESQQNFWEPPTVNTIKINFDGAAGVKGYACSAVAGDNKAKFQGYQSRDLNFTTAVEAEAFGALLGIELDIRHGWRNVVLEGDALNIINTLKYKHLPFPWRIQYIISRIRDSVHNFNSIEFRFIKKEANNVAHSLAAHDVSTHASDVWLSTPPSCTAPLIESEASSVL